MRALAALLLFAAPADPPPSVEALDARGGFRDVRLGSRLEDVPGLRPAGKDGELRLYTRPSDKLSLGDVRLTSITYAFTGDGRLLSIELTAPLLDALDPVRAILQAAYGPPTRPTGFRSGSVSGTEERWQGGAVDLRLVTSLYFSQPSTVDLVFESVPIRRELDEKAAAAAAARAAAAAATDL